MESLHLRLLACRWGKLAAEVHHWRYVNVSAPYWRLYWHDRAGAEICAGDDRVGLTPERLVLVPPNTTITTSSQVRERQLHMHFQILRPFLHVRNHLVVLPMDPPLVVLKDEVLTLLADVAKPSWRLNLMAQALVDCALSRTIETSTNVVQLDRRIAAVMADLDAAPGEAWTNVAMARRACLSVDAFIRLFKKQTGFTPHAYLSLKRVEKACLMLHHSESSIKEIAAETGFCDRYHFSRVFTRLQGVGPARFRRVG